MTKILNQTAQTQAFRAKDFLGKFIEATFACLRNAQQKHALDDRPSQQAPAGESDTERQAFTANETPVVPSFNKMPSAVNAMPVTPSVTKRAAITGIPVKPTFKMPASTAAHPRARKMGASCHVYIAGCPGLKALAFAEPGMQSRFKISLNESGFLAGRMQALNIDAYGAYVRHGDRMILEPGFDQWCLQQVVAQPTRPSSRVTVMPRSIQVDLPPGLSVKVFDDCLRARLAPRAVYAGCDNPHHRDGPHGTRYTAYSMGSQTRLSRVTEIYYYRLRQDGDWLVELIEKIITNFQNGTFAARPPVHFEQSYPRKPAFRRAVSCA